MNVTKYTLIVALSLISTAVLSQNKYGDLYLKVSPTEGSGANLRILVIDKDQRDTTLAETDKNGEVIIRDLYISGTDGIDDLGKNNNSLVGMVSIYNLKGQKIIEIPSENGIILVNEEHHLIPERIYLAIDQNGNTLKFLSQNRPLKLGKELGRLKSKTNFGESNIYEILIDGSGREFYPFIYRTDIELFEGMNQSAVVPTEYVEDKPVSVSVEIDVDGKAPFGRDATVTILPDHGLTTKVVQTLIRGVASFDKEAGVKAHPFGKFKREYTIEINPKATSTNRFEFATFSIDVILDSNNFIFEVEEFPVPVVEFEKVDEGWALPDPGPESSSGVTMDSDNTLWIMDFFDHHIFHYTTEGNDLGDGFDVDLEDFSVYGESITYDPTDDTFWITNANGENVDHYKKDGTNKVEDRFEIGTDGLNVALGKT